MVSSARQLLAKLTNRASPKPLPRGWYPGFRDGLATLHRPPLLDDKPFTDAVEHICSFKCFGEGGFLDYPVFRLYVVWQLVQASGRAHGDLVEFGTFRGGNAHVILSAQKALGVTRRLFLYDTFSGIPDRDLSAEEKGLAGRYQQTSVESVNALLGHDPLVCLRPGVIPDTLTTDGPSRISFMHVDLNVAKPTLDALKWAFPRWEKGGICVLDDYLWSGYEDQRRVLVEFFSSRALVILALPTGQGIVFNN
jgi:O-methyltransferase